MNNICTTDGMRTRTRTLRLWFIISYTGHKPWDTVESKEHSTLSLSDHDRRAHFPLCSRLLRRIHVGWDHSKPVPFVSAGEQWEHLGLSKTTPKHRLDTQWDWTGRKDGQKGPLPSIKSPGSFHPPPTSPSVLCGLCVLQNKKLWTKHRRMVLITAVLVMVHFKQDSQPVWTSHWSCYSPLSRRVESFNTTISLLWWALFVFACQTSVITLACVALLTFQIMRLNPQDPTCNRKEGNWRLVESAKAGRKTSYTEQSEASDQKK